MLKCFRPIGRLEIEGDSAHKLPETDLPTIAHTFQSLGPFLQEPQRSIVLGRGPEADRRSRCPQR